MSYELRFGTSIMAIQSSVDSTSAYADVDAVVGILNLYRMRLWAQRGGMIPIKQAE